jgi:hypothetical protein
MEGLSGLGGLELHIIMLFMNLVDCRALRCVNKYLSTKQIPSMKRFWFGACIFCDIKLKPLKNNHSRSNVFRSAYLQKNITLECECRCHRDCYAVASYTSVNSGKFGAHNCPKIHYKQLWAGKYIPRPLIAYIQKEPELMVTLRKWVIFTNNTTVGEIRMIITLRMQGILNKMEMFPPTTNILMWLTNSDMSGLEYSTEKLVRKYIKQH